MIITLSHKGVETIKEIPKLKLFIGQDKKRTRAPYEFLQEFQYGNINYVHSLYIKKIRKLYTIKEI